MNPENVPASHCHSLPRRTFLGGVGALVLAGVADVATGAVSAAPVQAAPADRFPQKPNIVVIITDQERRPMYWPQGWLNRICPTARGLPITAEFRPGSVQHRDVLAQSQYVLHRPLPPAQHGVTRTLTEGGTVSPTEPQLQVSEQNMAKLLASAGYNVQYRGEMASEQRRRGW